jgi:heat shock protein HslJ
VKQVLALIVAAAIAGCSGSAAIPDEPLTDRYWWALAIDGKAVTAADNHSEPHIVLTGGAKTHGSDGCNRFNGTYELDRGLRFGGMASTRMACIPPIDAQARQFSGALHATTAYVIRGRMLELIDADGRVRMRLESVALR